MVTGGYRGQTAAAMMSRKMSFLELWRSMKTRGDLLQRASQLTLLPSQLKWLLGDTGVRTALQNTRIASLLPPVGMEVFRRFTPASLGTIQQRHEAEEKERQTKKKNKEVAEHILPKPASDLEALKPLPFFCGNPPSELLNTPLEELDPFYQSQKTFIVVDKGNTIHRFNAEPACYLLTPFNPLRTVAIRILIHSLFRFFITVTILTNCVFMTMSDPPEWNEIVENVFIAIYTFEVLIKVMSRGLCVGRFTFLRDPWNWLDVMVIGTACLTKFVHLPIFYFPRVLKIIPIFPGMRMTAGAIVQSVKRLADVVVLAVFCLFVLALVVLQLFMGQLKHKCVQWPPLQSNITEDYTTYLLSAENYYFLPGQIDALLCGNASDAGICPEGYVCLRAGNNPNYGYTSYDSFGWSLLSLVRLLSQDFWENLVQLTMRAAGKSYFMVFVVFVFPGCFLILSLIVAVVAMAFCKREEAGITEAREREEEFTEILEVLKRREEEEASSRAAPSEEPGCDRQHSWCPPCCSVCSDFLLKRKCCASIQQRLCTFITNPFFDLVIVICLIINIILIAMEHYPMTAQFEEMLSVSHLVFTAIFTAEMVIKLVALGPYGYWQEGWNIFDGIVVIISIVELGLADVAGLSVVRSFRLFRAFRLGRWWPEFNMLLKIIWTSMKALRNLTLLLLIVVFTFTVAGMQLFGKDYKHCVCRIAADCELPRWHMADFFHAFLVIIRVLFGEWIEVTWDCMEVSGQPTCLIFFMVVLVIGNLLVLNLFLALLLSSISGDSLAERGKNNLQIAMSQIKRAVGTLLGKRTHINPDHKGVGSKEEKSKEYLTLTAVTSDQPVSEVKAGSSDHGILTTCDINSELDPVTETVRMPENEEENENKEQAEVQQQEYHEDHKGSTPDDCCSDKCYLCCPCLDIDTSRGGGRVWSNFRTACLSIVQHRCFNNFIIVIIVLSTAVLVFEDVHQQQRPLLNMVLKRADQVLTLIFLMEVCLRCTAFGLKRYLSDAWCWLDFLVVLVFLVHLAADTFGFFAVGAIQSLRALGPLRVLSRLQGTKVVVQSLVCRFPCMLSVLLVSLFMWLFFSVSGVNLFAGKFFYCYNETSEEVFLTADVHNKTECDVLIMYNYTEIRWKNLRFNYDNVANGYLTLLMLATSVFQFDVMYAAVDSTQVESQPVYESNLYMYLYFIYFLIFGFFFTFNFFIRVIINNLLEDKAAGKCIFMTKEQQKSCQTVKNLLMKPQKPVPRPQNRCQALLFDLVKKPWFEVVVAVLILLNMVVMMVETDAQSEQMDEILYWFDFVFIVLFLAELIVRITALRQHFFTDGLNILDFVVITVSIVGMFLADLIEKYFVSPSLFRVVRLTRVARVLLLIRHARSIRKLLFAFMMSLPALFNIGVILLIIMVTSSIFGMFNFAYVKKGAMIDDMFNFETFWNSMICLFMVTTSAGWDGLLFPMLNTPPDCDPYIEHPGTTVRGDCGSPTLAFCFFTINICLSFLLVIHLYIAVILETLSSEDTEPLSDSDLQMFYKTWRTFDPEGSQFIKYSQLSDFCDALRDPLKVPKPNSIKLIHMDLPLHPEDKIHCVDVLLALTKQVLGHSGKTDTLKARMEEKFMEQQSKVAYEPISSTLRRKQEDVAAAVIQRAYRKHVLHHRDATDMADECVDTGGALQ